MFDHDRHDFVRSIRDTLSQYRQRLSLFHGLVVLFLCLSLEVNGHTVDLHLAVRNNLLDLTLLLEILECLSCERAVDL